MTDCQLDQLLRWFDDYTSLFYGAGDYTDRNQSLKEHHSRRVSALCREIAEAESKDPETRRLAEAAGLFHDIGRFEQFRQYGSFNDRESVNHGEMGKTVLQREQPLKNLSEKETMIILTAVECHNRLELPGKTDEETLFYLKIVRDADKLDILALLTDYYTSPACGSNPALDLDLPDSGDIAPDAVADIQANRPVNMIHVRSIHDFKALLISWIFDLHFPCSRSHILKYRYIETLLNLLPPVAGRETIYNHVKKYQSFL